MNYDKDKVIVNKMTNQLLKCQSISRLSIVNNFIGHMAFTLAEILITLIIIGVVSSIVIPSIIADTQQAELKEVWKKTFAVVDQATKLMIMDNGGSMQGICLDWDETCITQKYAKYLMISKICNSSEGPGNCWNANGVVKFPNDWGSYNASTQSLALTNGTFITINWGKSSCGLTGWNGNVPKCALIAFDVNGFKGPNLVGKDVFQSYITKTGIVPSGVDGGKLDGYTCTIENGNLGCAATYLK